jgi:RNA polymerase sigma-70 factor (ECF subfamily)
MSVLDSFREANWLAKLNKCDKEAFGQCYDFYAPKLYRHAFYRLGSKELAEDVVSDVFTRTWEFLCDPTKRIDNLRAFLYRIANNLIIDFYRGKERQPLLIDEVMEAHLGDEGRGVKKAGKKMECEAVIRSLEKLPLETRELLIWRYIDELSIGEIAALSGKSPNAVYVAIHRALRQTKKY